MDYGYAMKAQEYAMSQDAVKNIRVPVVNIFRSLNCY